jgi:hypothetical protein
VASVVAVLALVAGLLAAAVPTASAAEGRGVRCAVVRHAAWRAQVCAWVRASHDRLGNAVVQGAGSVRNRGPLRVRSTVVLVSSGGPHMANRRAATTRRLVTRTSARVWVDGRRVRAWHGVRVWWPDGSSGAYLLRSGPASG